MAKKSQILQNGQIRFFMASAFKKSPKCSKLAMKWPIWQPWAGQFSHGKEKTKQWNYYETIALFTLFGKRLSKDRDVNPDVQLSEKQCLF